MHFDQFLDFPIWLLLFLHTLVMYHIFKYRTFVENTFWLKPWLKLISFCSIFSNLAKVVATTNSKQGLALLQSDCRGVKFLNKLLALHVPNFSPKCCKLEKYFTTCLNFYSPCKTFYLQIYASRPVESYTPGVAWELRDVCFH